MENGKKLTIIRNIIVAFSLYSKIPMPIFTWREEDMKHNLIFLPWVGIVIGFITTGLYFLKGLFPNIPMIAWVIIYSLVPIIITGGFHLDGFMDTEDALKSYKSKEEKLKILKDPHIGAFAIINLLVFAGIWLASMAVLTANGSIRDFILLSLIFVLSRCFSGITSISFKRAKNEGMLDMETKKAGKIDLVFLIIQLVFVLAFMVFINPCKAAVLILILILVTIIYKTKSYKEFGGVTGDTAGFYLCVSEESMLLTLSLLVALINIWSQA